MSTGFTFVNAVAARLFAEWWYERNFIEVTLDGATASVAHDPLSVMGDRFQRAANWFNFAAQSAREIGEGNND